MYYFIIKIFICYILIINLYSCTYISGIFGFNFKKPSITIDSIKLDNISYGSFQILVTFNILNENSYDLKIKDWTYNISINNDVFLDGKINKVFILKTKQLNQISLPLEISSESTIKLINLIFSKKNKKILINIAGKIFVTTVLGKLEVYYNQTTDLKI